jgi:hypothetical protein
MGVMTKNQIKTTVSKGDSTKLTTNDNVKVVKVKPLFVFLYMYLHEFNMYNPGQNKSIQPTKLGCSRDENQKYERNNFQHHNNPCSLILALSLFFVSLLLSK